MANLELLPHPVVTVIQGGIFLANAYVVKKLMVDPYLAVKKKRESRTSGAEEGSEAMVKEASELRVKAAKEIQAAQKVAFQEASSSKAEADSKKTELVSAAKASAEKEIETAVNDIQSSLEQALKQVPNAVAPLLDTMYDKALRKN